MRPEWLTPYEYRASILSIEYLNPKVALRGKLVTESEKRRIVCECVMRDKLYKSSNAASK
jgi:hypothetical protein